MRRLFLAVFLSFVVLVPSLAEACYTQKEVEAEQGVRIHSELMVIGLTCAHASEYEIFSARNSDLIEYYEKSLLEYYERHGAENPEEQLHILRTSMANQIAEHAVEMSVQSFCSRFGERAERAVKMDQQRVREWANYLWEENMLTQPVCKGSRV